MQRKHIVGGLLIAAFLLQNVIAAGGESANSSTTVTTTAQTNVATTSGSNTDNSATAKITNSSISPTTKPTTTTVTQSPVQTPPGTVSTTSLPTETTTIVTTPIPTTTTETDLLTSSLTQTAQDTEKNLSTISTMSPPISSTFTPTQSMPTPTGTTSPPSSTSTVASQSTQPSTTLSQEGGKNTDSTSSFETSTPQSTVTTMAGNETTGTTNSTSTTTEATTTAASTPTSTQTTSNGTTGTTTSTSTTTKATTTAASTPTSTQTTSNGTTGTTTSTSTTTKATTTAASTPTSTQTTSNMTAVTTTSTISSTSEAVTSTPTSTQTTTGNGTTGMSTSTISTTPEATTTAVTSTTTSIQTTTDIDDCDKQPCENGGTCHDRVNNYTCSCVPGWTGYNCSINIDDCDKQSCQNGGTCHDRVNNFTCSCVPGWTGNNCSINIDDCDKQPCENGGTCHDRVNNFTCSCVPGWTGNNCSINIDDCDKNSCENGGTCKDDINNFTCDCTTGWTGFNCSTDVDECNTALHNCDRNADCTNTKGGFKCQCKDGFIGEGINGNCTDIDECKNTPCHNSSTCFNTPGSYKCFCANGWTGSNCSTDINECDKTDSCANNSSCSNIPAGSYTCTCNEGYRGDGFNTCTQNVLIKVDPDVNYTRGDDDIFGPYKIDGGIPYFGRIYNTFYVSINGYITLGRSFNKKYPPSSPKNWSRFDHPIIAPLWADIEMKGPASGVSIKFEQRNERLQQISDALNISDVSKGIVVTWEKAVPYPYSQNANHEEADFQLIIYTSGSNTVLVFNYDQEVFTWTSSSDRLVAVGYSKEDHTGHIQFNGENFTMANKDRLDSAINGRWIFDVTSTSWIERFDCVHALKKLPNDSIRQDSEPCPCSLIQARMDLRFRFDREEPGYSIYRSRFRRKSYNSTQICHYRSTGSLIKGYPNGGYLDIDTNADVQNAYNMCCSNQTTCYLFYQENPSDSCSRYLPPTWSLSWGDPHITTLDGTNYIFSGRGEFTLLRHNETGLKVQVRTERPTLNNTAATVFVGFAAQVGNGSKVEILLNREANSSDIYINGNKTTPFSNSVQPFNHTSEGLYLTSNSTENPPTIKMAFESRLVIQVGVGNILDIIVSAPKDEDFNGTTEGLLGNNNGMREDDFVTKNGTTLNVSAENEEQVYPFGKSWMISEPESLFDYNKSGGNHSFFNNDALVKPSEFISNYTNYILRNCSGKVNISSCDGNKACIFDTAATCDENFGKQSKETEKRAVKEKEDIDSMPPTLNIQDPLYVGGANSTGKIEFHKVNISIVCHTNISNFICYNDSIHWNVSTDLRHSTVHLVITATGKKGVTSEYRPRIYYCGCQEDSECDYSFIYDDGPVVGSDNFFRARCNCGNDTTGDFCEDSVNLCYNNPCYENVTCNSSITSGNPCGRCTDGLVGDGLKCYDENECLTGKADCEQICTNTEGSYKCSCKHGFELISGNDCTDIDECSRNRTLCGDEMYCENTEGSFECLCRPGFANINGMCQNIQDGWSYAGVLGYTTLKTDTETLDEAIRTFLTGIYNTTEFHLAFVEIVSTNEIQNARKKRDTDVRVVYQTDFVLHLKAPSATSSVADKLKDVFKDYAEVGGSVELNIFQNKPFCVSLTKSKILSDQDGGMCKSPSSTTCDPISTNCSSMNGTYRCSCKAGFEGWEYPDRSCKDVNECEKSPDKCQEGICENYPGGFTCKCPAGYMYDNVEMCKDLCDPSPCLNDGDCVHGDTEGQYICKCDDKWAGQNCENENKQAEKLKIIAIAVGASVGAVCLLLLLALFGMYRRNKHKYSGYRRPLSTDFDSAFGITMPSVGTKDFPIDDDTDTAFSIPRPSVNRSDGYDHLTERERPDYRRLETGDSGRLEQPKEPLTKQTIESTEDDGIDNSSFLHSRSLEEERRTSKRISKNPYEYF